MNALCVENNLSFEYIYNYISFIIEEKKNMSMENYSNDFTTCV